MTQSGTDMKKAKENETVIPDSEVGFDHSPAAGDEPLQASDEPLTGETTERQPAWRPGTEPAGDRIYSNSETAGTDTPDEPEGRGI